MLAFRHDAKDETPSNPSDAVIAAKANVLENDLKALEPATVIKNTLKRILNDYITRTKEKNSSFSEKAKTKWSSVRGYSNADANIKICEDFIARIDNFDDADSNESLFGIQKDIIETAINVAMNTYNSISDCAEALLAANNYINRLMELRGNSPCVVDYEKMKEDGIEVITAKGKEKHGGLKDIKAELAKKLAENIELINSAKSTVAVEKEIDKLSRKLVFLGDSSPLTRTSEIKRLFPDEKFQYTKENDTRPSTEPQVNFNKPMVSLDNWLELYIQKNYKASQIKTNKIIALQFEKIANAHAKQSKIATSVEKSSTTAAVLDSLAANPPPVSHTPKRPVPAPITSSPTPAAAVTEPTAESSASNKKKKNKPHKSTDGNEPPVSSPSMLKK